jgi:hypothetical protein
MDEPRRGDAQGLLCALRWAYLDGRARAVIRRPILVYVENAHRDRKWQCRMAALPSSRHTLHGAGANTSGVMRMAMNFDYVTRCVFHSPWMENTSILRQNVTENPPINASQVREGGVQHGPREPA